MGGRNNSSLVTLQSFCSPDHPGATLHVLPLEFLEHTSGTVFLGETSEVPLAAAPKLPMALKVPPKHLG